MHNPGVHLMLVLKLLVLLEQLLGHVSELGQLTFSFPQLRVQVVTLFSEDVVSALQVIVLAFGWKKTGG